MAQQLILKTVDPHALAWWRSVQGRIAQANALVKNFGAEVTKTIGPCAAGADRHDIILSKTPDRITIIGVLAEDHERARQPVGTALLRAALVPLTGTPEGDEFSRLVTLHSSSGLLVGSLDVGVAPHLSDNDETTHHASFGVDPISGALFQYWPDTEDIRKAVTGVISRSGISWDESNEAELSSAKIRAHQVHALRTEGVSA